MAKLIRFLAASVGGGLVLGASIRLGETLAKRAADGTNRGDRALPGADARAPGRGGSGDVERNEPVGSRTNRLAETAGPNSIGRPEAQISSKETEETEETVSARMRPVAGVMARMDRQQADMEALKAQISGTSRILDSMEDTAARLRGELQKQLGESLDEQLAAAETKLHLAIEAAQRETAQALLASIETRVGPRINRLESDIAGQAEVLSELRDCSLQSERSIQRLLVALERAIGAKAGPAGLAPEPEAAPGAANPADSPRLAVMGLPRTG